MPRLRRMRVKATEAPGTLGPRPFGIREREADVQRLGAQCLEILPGPWKMGALPVLPQTCSPFSHVYFEGPGCIV